jgi:hypothetical protein
VKFRLRRDAMPELVSLADAAPASDEPALQRPAHYTAKCPPRRHPEWVKDQMVRERGSRR